MVKGIAGAVALLLLLAGCATGAGKQHDPGQAALTARHSTATVRHTFAPYDSSGRLTVPVARHATGNCFTTSLAAPGGATYRCFAGNQILDPCFARPGTTTGGGTLACVADPWSKATVLTVTKTLPGGSSVQRVWAFRRADGARCVAATGTVPAVHGRNLDYHCSDGTFAALVDPHAGRVEAVFAKIGATALRRDDVRALWAA